MKRLTREQVADARRRYARREATAAVLAAELDVSVSTVKHAVTGRTWAHLTDPPPVRKARPPTWRGRSTTVTPSILLAIFDDRRDGATWRSIGERHRLDHTVVFRAQIAAALGLARGTVSAWAAEMGLPERSRGRRRSRA